MKPYWTIRPHIYRGEAGFLVREPDKAKGNMFGLLPCPKCGSEFRWPSQHGEIICDDCGHKEPTPVTKEDA